MEEQIGLTAEQYRAVIAIVDERLSEVKVTRESFDRLSSLIGQLTNAQMKAEERLSALEGAVEELAQAQRDLAQAQARTEERVGGLEQAVERLAQAQARTEEAVKELAQAQAATVRQMRNLAQQVGALSENIGFGLEDIARVMLPPYLERHQGVLLEGELGEELRRRFFQVEGREIEFNLYGEGWKDGQRVTVLGESKSRIFGREVEEFAEKLSLVEPLVEGEVLRVMFGFYIHPTAISVAHERDILLVASYQR